jgi:tryptophan-rich sensory protein
MSNGPTTAGLQHSEDSLMITPPADPKVDLPFLLRSLALPLFAGAIGSAATYPNLAWFDTLEKPAFSPPKAVFGPVWTTLYLLMGAAHYLVTTREAEPAATRAANILYGLQLALNALWSILFFGRRSPLAALIEIGLLWTAIVLTIIAFARISRGAALLLVPYLLWTTFATVLNATIWRLNAGATRAR